MQVGRRKHDAAVDHKNRSVDVCSLFDCETVSANLSETAEDDDPDRFSHVLTPALRKFDEPRLQDRPVHHLTGVGTDPPGNRGFASSLLTELG